MVVLLIITVAAQETADLPVSQEIATVVLPAHLLTTAEQVRQL